MNTMPSMPSIRGPRKVRSLAHAIQVFEYKKYGKVKILQDVNWEGARIGRLYRDLIREEKILLLFKREYYYSFSKHFPDIDEEDKGYGVINNLKITHWAALQDATIAVMFADGKCYGIDAMEFYLFYEKYGTDVLACPGEIAAPLSRFRNML